MNNKLSDIGYSCSTKAQGASQPKPFRLTFSHNNDPDIKKAEEARPLHRPSQGGASSGNGNGNSGNSSQSGSQQVRQPETPPTPKK